VSQDGRAVAHKSKIRQVKFSSLSAGSMLLLSADIALPLSLIEFDSNADRLQ
jgi:hypothetical protein